MVDLPHPDGPSNETNSPRPTAKLKFSIATTSPKRTLRLSIERMGLDGTRGAAPNRSVRTHYGVHGSGLGRERLCHVDRLLLEAGAEQKFLHGVPAGLIHKADGLLSGLSSGRLAFIIASS